jgi:tRNA uridine 5-carboxymethylaminomethyl modification enzyme
VNYSGLLTLLGEEQVVDDVVAEQVVIRTKYAGYINRQQNEINRMQRHESTMLPDDINYKNVRGLSNEVREKLEQTRPNSLGQAARISGVTPAAVSLLLVHLKREDQSVAS